MFKSDPENNSLMQAIKSGIVDGVLIASRMPLGILSKISAACPAVSINNVFGDGSEIPCFSCNHFRVGFLAGKYLLANGHRRLAYITDNLFHPEAELQLCGFKSALEMREVEFTDADILETRRDHNIFNKRVKEFCQNSTHTAYFVRHTIYALKIITVLRKIGLKVPEDISIISCGNYKNDLRSYTELTTIDNQICQMCRTGLECLLDIIRNNNKPEGGLKLLSPQIIENNSVINVNS
jgi:DNA-binding LacI/PurR family transcriptional regulator